MATAYLEMKTLGIDLASAAKKTAACLLEWKGKKVFEPRLVSQCSDETLDKLINEADAVGIDAPFGWPIPFANAVSDWTYTQWDEQLRDDLTLRETDRAVKKITNRTPLRVSADRIAMPAMRAMALLMKHGSLDRSGPVSGKFFEVYPAASLASWNFTTGISYKSKISKVIARDERKNILIKLHGIYEFGYEQDEKFVQDDDNLDSLVAALTARAAKLGKTIPPIEAQQTAAREEGWIHVPKRASANRAKIDS